MSGVSLHTKANDRVAFLENVVEDNLSWNRLLDYLFWLSSFYYYYEHKKYFTWSQLEMNTNFKNH